MWRPTLVEGGAVMRVVLVAVFVAALLPSAVGAQASGQIPECAGASAWWATTAPDVATLDGALLSFRGFWDLLPYEQVLLLRQYAVALSDRASALIQATPPPAAVPVSQDLVAALAGYSTATQWLGAGSQAEADQAAAGAGASRASLWRLLPVFLAACAPAMPTSWPPLAFVPAAALSAAGVGCADFAWRWEAEALFEMTAGDGGPLAALDGAGDGHACASLPGAS